VGQPSRDGLTSIDYVGLKLQGSYWNWIQWTRSGFVPSKSGLMTCYTNSSEVLGTLGFKGSQTMCHLHHYRIEAMHNHSFTSKATTTLNHSKSPKYRHDCS
jgi:hypothetical protein